MVSCIMQTCINELLIHVYEFKTILIPVGILIDIYVHKVSGILAITAFLSQTNVNYINVGCQECIKSEAHVFSLKTNTSQRSKNMIVCFFVNAINKLLVTASLGMVLLGF